MNLSEPIRSRLYAQLIGTLLGFVLFVWAVAGLFVTSIMVQDPATGRLSLEPRWVGTWLFFASIAFLLYTTITLGVFLVALRHHWTDPADCRALKIGSYLMLPMFPVGTIYSIYAASKMATSKQLANKAETDDTYQRPC